ncbi:hypothetical protein FRAHR75_400038 [Frankia sp. Hr75.2]|nr:hypothetical protein FRAHR75_400038 [Frankia sp. Hr75.2]
MGGRPGGQPEVAGEGTPAHEGPGCQQVDGDAIAQVRPSPCQDGGQLAAVVRGHRSADVLGLPPVAVRWDHQAAGDPVRQPGAQVIVGDLDDRGSLDAAAEGAHGVFSVQQGALGTPPVPFEDEVGRGRNVADAAAAARVPHLVYASVAGVERGGGGRAFASKRAIEEHIRRIDIPATILRPASFMENYADPAFGVQTGTLATPFAPDIPEQLIALDDIGAFVALAFTDPVRYLGRAVAIAGDALRPGRTAEVLSRATGREIRYVHVPVDAGPDPECGRRGRGGLPERSRRVRRRHRRRPRTASGADELRDLAVRSGPGQARQVVRGWEPTRLSADSLRRLTFTWASGFSVRRRPAFRVLAVRQTAPQATPEATLEAAPQASPGAAVAGRCTSPSTTPAARGSRRRSR